LLRLHDAL